MGAAFSFLFGGAELLLEWLMIFVIADFISGNIGALKSGEWVSSKCGLGVIKKVLYFAVVAGAHGLDVAFESLVHLTVIEDIVICAFMTAEFGSILENLERCGLAGIVPPSIRHMIKALNGKVDKQVANLSE